MADETAFANLGSPRRIWAVAAIHGERDRLVALHQAIAEHALPGDRVVYLGSYLGRGGDPAGTVDELLRFRRELIARPGWLVDDVVFLRGAQEEMWQKLLQIQFAPNPTEVLGWMLRQGVEATLLSYGGTAEQARSACRQGAVEMNRWTTRLRDAIRSRPGHEKLLTVLQRAAFTADGGVLFLHAGLDPDRPLAAQGDSFWWDGAGLDRVQPPYGTFRRIVRGFDPARRGPSVDGYAVTLDAGSGFGGGLRAGLFLPDGSALQMFEA